MPLDPLTNTVTYRIHELNPAGGPASGLGNCLVELEQPDPSHPSGYTNKKETLARVADYVAGQVGAATFAMTQEDFADAYADEGLAAAVLGPHQGKLLIMTGRAPAGTAAPNLYIPILAGASLALEDGYTVGLVSDGQGGSFTQVTPVSYNPATDVATPRTGGGIAGATAPLLYDAATRVVSIRLASDSQSGAITDADFLRWENKQNALGYTPQDAQERGEANGYAPLDAAIKVPVFYLPDLAIAKIIGLQTALDDKASTTYVNTEIATAVNAVFRAAGNYDASTGAFPTTGTGASNGVRRGDTYKVSAAGTLGSLVLDIGDHFYAVVANPGQVDANWARFEYNTDQATTGLRGTVRLATSAEALTGTDTQKAVTPAALAAVAVTKANNAGATGTVATTLTFTEDRNYTTPLTGNNPTITVDLTGAVLFATVRFTIAATATGTFGFPASVKRKGTTVFRPGIENVVRIQYIDNATQEMVID